MSEDQEKIKQLRMLQIQNFYPSTGSYRSIMTDRERNIFYKNAIDQYCKDKVVLDLGAGLGLLSLMAIRAGAKKVYAVEVNPVAIKALQKLKEDENLLNLVIVESTSWELDLPENVDVIVHEIFGPFLLDEMCLYTLKDVEKFLKPGGILIPEKFGFDFKFFDSEKIPSISYIKHISKSYDTMMQTHQTIIEDIIKDDDLNWISFGSWGFYNYPTDPLSQSFTFEKETRIDSLWCRPFITMGNKTLYLNRTKENRHWGNSFLRFGKMGVMELGVELTLHFRLDESLTSFVTGIDSKFVGE
jgi:SAM-dependent methyltransferase